MARRRLKFCTLLLAALLWLALPWLSLGPATLGLTLGLSLLPVFIFGAVTVTQSWRTPDAVEYTVTATADADTVMASTAHGMGAEPKATILPILQAPAGASLWAVTTLDGTNFVGTKSTAVGSGNAGPQIRIRVERKR